MKTNAEDCRIWCRRIFYDLDYFNAGGIERRSWRNGKGDTMFYAGSPEAKEEYRRLVGNVLGCWNRTPLNTAQIARIYEKPDTLVRNIIEGNHPKWYQEELDNAAKSNS